MKITALEEYGLRCMMQLGRCAPGQSLTIGEIAEREGLSVANVRKLMALLRETGLVQSVRGRAGGYTLAGTAADIPLGRILESLGGRLYDKDYCARFTGPGGLCSNSPSCTLRSLWGILDGIVHGVLQRMSLAELILEGAEVKRHLRTHLENAIGQMTETANRPATVKMQTLNT
jgi:Rrf2 family iron-sulfur cluster assembly transcriptional regulator